MKTMVTAPVIGLIVKNEIEGLNAGEHRMLEQLMKDMKDPALAKEMATCVFIMKNVLEKFKVEIKKESMRSMLKQKLGITQN